MDKKKFPMLAARRQTRFFSDLTSEEKMNVNGSPMSPAVWNIIVSHRDLKMWCLHGWKPHRGWKVSAVKAYFGLKGSGEKLLKDFEALKAEVDDLMGV